MRVRPPRLGAEDGGFCVPANSHWGSGGRRWSRPVAWRPETEHRGSGVEETVAGAEGRRSVVEKPDLGGFYDV